MAVTIKLRRALSGEWNSVNPVLSLGEPGYEIDTKKIKIGDGVNTWSNLEYVTQDFIDVVSSGGLVDLTQIQQDGLKEGSLVLTSDGVRWFYKGTGSKTDPSSYVQLADISPTWSQITNVPSSLVGLAGIPSTLAGDIILASGNNIYYATSFAENVDDRLAQLLVGGDGINVSYNDAANSLTISANFPTSFDGGELTYSPANSSPLAFWTMNETIGSRKDVSGNNIHLYDGNLTTQSTTGILDNAIRVKRKNYLYANNNFNTRKSISLWVKINGSQTAAPNTLMLFGSEATGSFIRLNSSNIVEWRANIGNTTNITTLGFPLSINTWHHLVFTYDSSTNECKQYQDGVLVNAVAVSGSLISDPADILKIGPFTKDDISLDCIGVWNRTLNDSEIVLLYNNGSGYSFANYSEPVINESLFINTSVTTPLNSLSIAVSGTANVMVPSFNSSISDYCIKTNSLVTTDVISYTLTVDGVDISGSGNINKLIKVSNGTKNYYIRLLPSDMPIGDISVSPTNDYIPGYYLVTGRRDTDLCPNYNMLYNQYGVPVWYQTSPAGLPQIFHPGNDKNKILIGRRGSTGVRYGMELTNSNIPTRQYNLLQTTKNGTPYLFDWQQHEFIELSGPPNRRGNILTVAFVPTPSTTTTAGQTAIADNAFGVYIQEQNPSGTQIVWEWWSGDHFNVGTVARTSSAFHLNALDVHPITGDIVCSFRGCSAILCIEYATKKVKWVIQGPAQSLGTLYSMRDPVATADTKWLTLESEPTVNGFQYVGPAGQHHIKWRPNIDPLTVGNDVVSVFDNQTNFFSGNNTSRTLTSLTRNGTTVTGVTSTNHGFVTGDAVQVSGSSISSLNGVFYVTVSNTTTFTYTSSSSGDDASTGSPTVIKGTNYFPSAGPKSRGLVYEIDLVNNKAIHRSSAFGTVPSAYLGSYTILEYPDGRYSHIIDYNGEHPVLKEYSDAGNGTSPGNPTFVMDFAGDFYRIIKVPLDFFNINYLRATTALPPTF